MSETYHWTCPYCDRDTTLREGDYHLDSTHLYDDNADGPRRLESLFIVCPNPRCRKITLVIKLFEIEQRAIPIHGWTDRRLLKEWLLIPPSKAKPFPNYVPQVILDDYNEACIICRDSPKASATLSRRCLQGIIRDFWKVKPGRLVDEMDQIKDNTDPLTWEAIDSVRKVGNIGAHMEKDINLIVDVDPNEAELLIGLIETLIRDWYIAREERKNRLSEIKKISEAKDKARLGTSMPPQQTSTPPTE